jgi:hypothetical protein
MIPEEITYNEALKGYLFKFLRENLKINVWCDYDGCYSPRVNVSLDLCGEEIHRSSDNLLAVN